MTFALAASLIGLAMFAGMTCVAASLALHFRRLRILIEEDRSDT